MQFMAAGSMNEGLGGTKLLHATRLPTTDPIAISKIYPTPPSVETSDKRYDEPEMMEESGPVSIWEGEVSHSCFLSLFSFFKILRRLSYNQCVYL